MPARLHINTNMMPFTAGILPSIEECKPTGKNEPHDMTSPFYLVSFS